MKKVIILSLDNVSSIGSFIEKMKEVFCIPGVKDGVAYIKINDACHMYGGGVALLDQIISFLDEKDMKDIKIFLDLKISDVVGTIKNTLSHYSSIEKIKNRIGIVTVSTACSVKGVFSVGGMFPGARVAMVSLLTDIDEAECKARYGSSPEIKILEDLFGIIDWCELNKYDSLPFDTVVCSPHEVGFVKESLEASKLNLEFVVPGIRDEWMINNGDAGQQKRYTGVYEALLNGATYVVMGAQIVQGNPGKEITPEQSVKMTLEEIQEYYEGILVPVE